MSKPLAAPVFVFLQKRVQVGALDIDFSSVAGVTDSPVIPVFLELLGTDMKNQTGLLGSQILFVPCPRSASSRSSRQT